MSRSTPERGDMRHYRHLGAEERDRIAEMCARHERVSAIAAQSRSDARREACRPRKRLSDPALAAEVRMRIVDDRWSPEQIDGRSRLERGGRCVVSFSTVYRAVSAGELDPPRAAPGQRVRGRLRRGGRRPRRGREETRGKIRVDHEVSERPREADARSRLGDWEDDTVVGPTPACLVTMTDGASRLLVGGRARARSSAEVAKVEVRALAGRPLETVTPDGGKEFANHREAGGALGGVPSCLCRPRHPWQKPTVENTNGLIREFFPKGTDFSRVTDEEARGVFEKVNDRPRKVLGFRTANEVYGRCCTQLDNPPFVFRGPLPAVSALPRLESRILRSRTLPTRQRHPHRRNRLENGHRSYQRTASDSSRAGCPWSSTTDARP